jgi:hypothetical protein
VPRSPDTPDESVDAEVDAEADSDADAEAVGVTSPQSLCAACDTHQP